MFTILSCDWGRTIPYWIISSFFFYHTFKGGQVAFTPLLSRMSTAVQQFITGNRFLRSPYTYITLVLLAPVPSYFAPLDHINTIQQRICLWSADIIHQIASLIS